jgi:hypothetical protein
MPRYEIVAHVVCDLECATPEAAAAVIRARWAPTTGGAMQLRRLGVWHEEESPAASPLPPGLRRQLIDFFAGLERSAAAAEETFRGKVAAILGMPEDRPAPAGAAPEVGVDR